MKSTILKECVRIAKEKNKFKHIKEPFRHFSFIIQRNTIIEWGTNRRSGSPPIFFGYPLHSMIHSELDAYNKARGLLEHNKDFEIVNIRLNKRGKLRLSKPCEYCYAFMKAKGASCVWFSTDIDFAKILL